MPESKRAPIPKTRPEDRTTAGWQRVSSPTKEEIRAALAKDPYQTEAALGLADNELMLDAEERENTLSAFGMEDLSNETDTGELNKRIEHYEATDTDRNNNFLLKTGRGIDVLSAAAVDHRNHGETKGWYTPDSGVVTMNTNDEGTNAEGVTRKEARQKLTDEGKWRDGRVNTLVHESMHHAFSKIREGGIPAREGNVALDILSERVAPNFSVAVEHVILNSILQRDSIKNKQNVMAHTSPVTDYIANPSKVNEDHVRVFIKDRSETLKSNKITAGELQAINAFNGWRAESWKSKTMKGDEYIKGFLDQLVQSADVVEGLAQERLTELRAATLEKGSKGFAEGGMNTNMNDEMSSMMQEAPEVDPVSGNEVPIGSEPKEVRDDIPARLSEGEMVIPADVVKFFGVEYFMKLRDKAKKGFARMEEMGQMGNGDAASGPDELFSESGGEAEEEDLPFTLEDFDVDEEGPVEAAEGLYVGDNDVLSGIFGNNASFDTGTNNSNTDTTPTPDPTEAPDFDNTDVDGEDFQSYFKDNPGFSQSNLVSSLGEGDAGLKNYNYLVGNLFGEDSAMLDNLDIFNQVNNSNTENATGNPVDAFAGLPADQQQILSGVVRGNLEKIGGDASDTQADTTVSVSELSSIPSEQNLASLQSFASIPSSIIGIADQLMGQAINPLGRASAPLGLAQRGIANVMGINFDQINTIASVQQQQAKTNALQMANQLANMAPAVKAELAVLAQLQAAGIDPESLTANQQAVSFADPVTGAPTVGVAYGTPGKGFSHVGVPSSYMSMEVVAGIDKSTISPIGPPSQEALDEMSTAADVQAAVGSTTPAEDMFGGITGYGNQDVDSMMGFGNANHGYGGGVGSNDGDNDGSNDGGDGNSAGQGDGAGTGSGGGTDAAGDPGEGDGDGSVFKHGGFVKKRRKPKRDNKRRGLASR